MKSIATVLVAILIIAFRAESATNSTSLVKIDSGDPNTMMRIVELERNAKTSKLKLTAKKLTSVGSSMFIMRAFYEVAKARSAEYFIILKEWDDTDGGHLFIGGFTNTKDADIHKEFGTEYALTNDYGQSREYMSVSQCSILFDIKLK